MFSFFGDEKPGSSSTSGVIVSKAIKKTVVRPTTNNLKPSSTSRLSSNSGPSRSPALSGSSTPRRPSYLKTPSASSAKVKRKKATPTPSRIQSESESETSSDDALDPKPKKKRGVGLNGSRGGTGTPLPYQDELVSDKWCLDLVDERGEWGRGWVGFIPCEEAVRGIRKGWASGYDSKPNDMDKYLPYFPQDGFDKKDGGLPRVKLQYPAPGCEEEFVLLNPTSSREYSPISELRNVLRLILEFYIPPSHQHIFGSMSDTFLDLDPVSHTSSPAPTSSPPTNNSPLPAQETIGDALRKALAPNRRDGPGFVRAIERFNEAMREIQADGSMQKHLADQKVKARDWSGIVEKVNDMAYARVVGPYSNELEHHPKHPEEVARAISGKEDAYGELRHSFLSKVIEQTKLGVDSVFVDLGSGVGNCVFQASLQAGCQSHAYELLPVPAHCARLQLREVQRRWAMFGLKGNLEITVNEGDFRVHPTVAKRLREADVVLVNNEVFPPSLNADLTNMFLDLKEGATIVSLKPFVPEAFKMNEANCDSFAAIVRMTPHSYYKDWVSWKGDSGTYYVQVIDRSMRIKFDEDLSTRRRMR